MSTPENGKASETTTSTKWTCQFCTYSENTGDCCVSCKKAKVTGTENIDGAKALQELFQRKTKGKWQCPVCLIYNDAKRLKCASCDADKPGSEGKKKEEVKPAATGGFFFPMASTPTSTFANKPVSGFSFNSSSSAPVTFTFGGQTVTMDGKKVSVVPEKRVAEEEKEDVKKPKVEETPAKKPVKKSKKLQKERRMEINKKRMATLAKKKEQQEKAYEASLVHCEPTEKEVEERKKEIEAFKTDKRAAVSPVDSKSQYKVLDASEKNYTVFVWGSCELGQLGLGDDFSTVTAPTELKALTGKNIARISCGGVHTMAVSSGKDNTLYSWGVDDDSLLGREGNEIVPMPVVNKEKKEGDFIVQIFAGQSHNVVLTKQSNIYGWGLYRDSRGALDWCRGTHIQPIPRQIPFPVAEKILQIACGDNHTMALTESGKVFGWGVDEQGQLGLGRHTRSFDPYQPAQIFIPHKSDEVVKSVFAGGMHSMVLTSNHHLYTTGLNNYGQLGLGHRVSTSSFTLVEAFCDKPIVALDGGQHHTLALDEDGHVYCCGRGSYGQLGLASYRPEGEVYFTLVEELENIPIQQIACGDCHSMALSTKGDVYCWGFNGVGQVGNGNYDDQCLPKKVEFESTYKSVVGVQISAGGQHSACLARVSL